MKKHLFILVFCLFAMQVVSQSISLKGKVMELCEEGSQPVGYATVTLLNKDSVMIAGTTSGEDGSFALSRISADNYQLHISYVGYESAIVLLSNLSRSMDLGEICIESKDMMLNDVTVTASQVIHKVDRQILLPTQQQIKTTTSILELLNAMTISRLNVDFYANKLETSGGDAVQVRINGRKASGEEFRAIRAKDVVRIEYIEDPGKRYGEEALGAVVNVIVRQQESGGSVMANLGDAFTSIWGENQFSFKYNHKKSEWGIGAFNSNRGFRTKADLTEAYHLDDYTIERRQEGEYAWQKSFHTFINLSYALTDPDKYVFYVNWGNRISRQPMSDRRARLFTPGSDMYSITDTRSSSSGYTPTLDLYYLHHLPKDQTLEMNVTGTWINTNNYKNYREYLPSGEDLALITTDVDNTKRSVIGEVIYEKSLKHVKLSGGGRHYQGWTENIYTGNNPTESFMDDSKTSLFAELQGKVNSFSYAGSVGMTRSWFKQGEEKMENYIFTPSVRLSFGPYKNSFFRYHFRIDPSIPSLGSLTDIELERDTIVISRGNPYLHSYRTYWNNFSYNYTWKKFRFNADFRHRWSDKPIMETYFAEGNRIIEMQENQKSFRGLTTAGDISVNGLDLGSLKNFLTLQANVGYNRYTSHGNTYRNVYEYISYRFTTTMMYKNAMAIVQVGHDPYWAYGQTFSKNFKFVVAMLKYKYNNWNFGFTALILNDSARAEIERISDVAPQHTYAYMKESVIPVLEIGYNFNFGRKFKSINKRLNNSDNDSGIAK